MLWSSEQENPGPRKTPVKLDVAPLARTSPPYKISIVIGVLGGLPLKLALRQQEAPQEMLRETKKI